MQARSTDEEGMVGCPRIVVLLVCAVVGCAALTPAFGEGFLGGIFPEQRRMEIREPSELPQVRLPDVPTPPTVAKPVKKEPLHLSLDDAIRIALENSDVVRVLTGAGATSSGSTIYDPAITNTQVDQAKARFDPNLQLQNDFDRIETPQGTFAPANTNRARIEGDRIDQYSMGLGVSKTTTTGGTASLSAGVNRLLRSDDGQPLNPRASSSVDMSFTQPLLQGGGIRANLAPIEIARIDTERSFYQLKQSVQQLVRGVIDGYWALVLARVDVWARDQQAKQGREDLVRVRSAERVGRADKIDVAQVESAAQSFEARLVTARASLLRREAALRNILGLPPSDPRQIIPVTPPTTDWIGVEWKTIVWIAQAYRPDLIELKLRIEADQQQLLIARNESRPRVDASALYRWDALGGRGPNGEWVGSEPGQFTGWQLGIDVSMPLGLRQSRAALRQSELSLVRDRANLEQALHNASHLLAENYRNLAQYYEEYRAFKKTREAALVNLVGQTASWNRGLGVIYLNVLQARTSWGDAIDAEAQSLVQYNSEFAALQEQMGTILEAHGVRFVEEPYSSVGPLGRLCRGRWYPRASRPGAYTDQYERGDEPAENIFELDEPVIPGDRRRDRPRPPRPAGEAAPDAIIQPQPDVEPFESPARPAAPTTAPSPRQAPQPPPSQRQSQPPVADPAPRPGRILDPLRPLQRMPVPEPGQPQQP